MKLLRRIIDKLLGPTEPPPGYAVTRITSAIYIWAKKGVSHFEALPCLTRRGANRDAWRHSVLSKVGGTRVNALAAFDLALCPRDGIKLKFAAFRAENKSICIVASTDNASLRENLILMGRKDLAQEQDYQTSVLGILNHHEPEDIAMSQEQWDQFNKWYDRSVSKDYSEAARIGRNMGD